MKIKLDQKEAMYKRSRLPSFWTESELAEYQLEVVEGYRYREFGSSLIGRLVDNIIFETLAFLGVLPLTDFLNQAVMAYIEGVVMELILIALVSEPLVQFARKYVEK